MTLTQAFLKSLKKWSDIIEGVPGVNPWSDCALCEFKRPEPSIVTDLGPDIHCFTCPLVLYGGDAFSCVELGSPWWQAAEAWLTPNTQEAGYTARWEDIPRIRGPKATETAMAMYLAILMAQDAYVGIPEQPE